MHFPELPLSLQRYQHASSPSELLALLSKEPTDLIQFFEAAADDETWSEGNRAVMKELIDCIILKFNHHQLEPLLSLSAAHIVRKHYINLAPLLAENIKLQFKDRQVAVNSLLLGTLSEFFNARLRLAFQSKDEGLLLMADFTYEQFMPFEEFMQRGALALHRLDAIELKSLLKQAQQWGVHTVEEMCQQELYKYIDREQVADQLILAHTQHWELLKQRCLTFLNAYSTEFSLQASSPERLEFTFLGFNERAILAFEQFSPYLTDLGFHASLVGDFQATALLRRVPFLTRLNLSKTDSLGNLLTTVPIGLKELDLSDCPWIEPGQLKQCAEACPQLEQLCLCGNTQLKYMVWGELLHFSQLQRLDLSRCYSLSNQDLMLILKACPFLTDLSLNECTTLDDEGFALIAKYLPQLMTLSLSHCALTDRAVVEIADRCKLLRFVDLSRCGFISDKGVLQLIKQVPNLQKLNLEGCTISKGMEYA